MSELPTNPASCSRGRRSRLSLSFVIVVVLVTLDFLAPANIFSHLLMGPFPLLFLLLWLVLLLVVGCRGSCSGCSCSGSSCCNHFLAFLPFSLLAFALLVVLNDVDVLVDVADGLTRQVRVAVGEEVADHLSYFWPSMVWSHM